MFIEEDAKTEQVDKKEENKKLRDELFFFHLCYHLCVIYASAFQ